MQHVEQRGLPHPRRPRDGGDLGVQHATQFLEPVPALHTRPMHHIPGQLIRLRERIEHGLTLRELHFVDHELR